MDCIWCSDPNSEDYDCHSRCKCVCHEPDVYCSEVEEVLGGTK